MATAISRNRVKLLQLPPPELRRQLAGPGIWLRTGPFSLRLRSTLGAVARGLGELYGQFEVRNPRETFADFHVSVAPGFSLRRWLRPEAHFSFDGVEPIPPQPRGQAFPLLERGLDWCVATHAHHYLVVQAAALEKHGRAVLIAPSSGTGDAALVAALALSGWRLLSDTLTLIDRESGLVHALPRPLCLTRGEAAEIRDFSGDAPLHEVGADSAAGTLVYLCPPKESVRRQHEPAAPAWILFPERDADAGPEWRPCARAEAFKSLVHHARNYSQLGSEGFRTCAALIEQSACLGLRYGKLDAAVAALDALAATVHSSAADH